MTIASETERVVYIGSGITGPFTIPFFFIENDDISVIRTTIADGTEVTLLLTTDYALTGAGDPSGGSLTLVVALSSAFKLTISRNPDTLQGTDYTPHDNFPAESHERALDKLTMLVQRMKFLFNNKMARLSDGDVSGLNPALPTPIAEGLLRVNAAKTAFEWVLNAGTVAVSAFGQTLVNAANAAAARVIMDVPSNAEVILDTLFAAKGDLLGASANDAPVIVPVGASGDILVPSSGNTDGLAWVGQGAHLFNGSFSVTVAANALTIALKTDGGADPSDADPVFVAMPNAVGGWTVFKITAAMSLVLSSGSTLGTISAQAHRIYFGLADDAATLRLWAYNPWFDSATVPSLVGIVDGQTYSSTAEGGAGAADSSQVLYSATAFTAKIVRALGYFESTQAAAGTWVASPSRVSVLKPGDKRTSDRVQLVEDIDGALATTTTVMPFDNTTPQNTEGAEFLQATIIPVAAIDILVVTVTANIVRGAGTIVGALFLDSAANALVSHYRNGDHFTPPLTTTMLAGTITATTFKYRAGPGDAGTITFNGDTASSAVLNGTAKSRLRIEEIFV